MSPRITPAGQFSVDQTIVDGVSHLGTALSDSVRKTEIFVRREPASAVFYSVLAGYLLRFFPFISLFRALISLILALVRPLAFLYVLAKAFEIVSGSNDPTGRSPRSK